MLDIFGNDAFSEVALTDAINEIQHVPGRIGELGIFQATSVNTRKIAIEKKGDILELIPPTPRGAPGTTLDKEKRDIRDLEIPHFEISDAVYADEVQDVRAFGQEALQTVVGRIAERFVTHQNSHSATEEYARLGAVKGVITYADGSTLDLFNFFGVTQETSIDFDLDAASPVLGALRIQCQQIHRQIADLLGAIRFTGIHGFCGNAFFDALIGHAEVRDTYKQAQDQQDLRQSYVSGGSSYGSFKFGGITWENYRGKVSGTDFVDTDSVHLFPTGARGLFRTVYGPADYNDSVNRMGKRLFAKQYRMPNDKGVNLDTQMNALHYCTRPKVLLQGTRT